MSFVDRLPASVRPAMRTWWFACGAVFGLALILRVAWVLLVDRDGFVLNDAFVYHTNARRILDGVWFQRIEGGPSAQWPPGYAVVLAGVYGITGVDPVWGELFNALIGAGTAVLVMVLIRRVGDQRTAVVGGVMFAVLPGPILWTDVLVAETLYTALFVVLLIALSYATPSWPWMVVIGAIVGVGALVRGEALTWGVLPIVLFWRDLPKPALFGRLVVAGLTAVVFLAPWTIRNAVVMDAFVPVATNASNTLWSGHHDGATGGQTYPPPEYFDRFDPTPPAFELESSAALRSDAIDFMVSNPIRELELIPLKLIHLNRGDSYALDWVNDAPEVAPISPINIERIGVIADIGYYGLLTLFIVGAVVLGRPFWGSRMGRVFTASLITALFLYGFLYYGNYRYRLPYSPIMVVVASTFLIRVWDHRRDLAGGAHVGGDGDADVLGDPVTAP